AREPANPALCRGPGWPPGGPTRRSPTSCSSVPPPSAPISAAPWASWAPATVLNSWSSRSGRGSSFPRSEEIVHDRNDHPNRVPARALGVLMMLEALSFLGFALLHLGVRIAAD